MKRLYVYLRKKINFRRWLKLSGIALAVLVLVFIILHLLFPLPALPGYSTVVYDSEGKVLHAYLTRDEKWRMKTELNEISPLLQKTIIEKEDKYFYAHPGINAFAVIKALAGNITSGKRQSGASTITMQVARLLQPRKRNWGSKIIEAFRAIQLELKYSKKEILQLYLNLVPYGGNIEGVKSAAYLYFNKNPDHLSLAEITALSIIPNRPSSLKIGMNNDVIVAERNRWLKKFARTKVFTDKQIEDALAEPLVAYRGRMPQLAPHLSYKLAKTGATAVYSTINTNMQLKTEKLVADYVRVAKLSGIHNAAVIVVDNKTGSVITYVGSADFADTTDAGQVNGAAAIRQPGSTLKPLVYGLAFDEGMLTPKQMIKDLPLAYKGYAPENYDKKFHGMVTTAYALEHSLNLPAVRTLQMVTGNLFIDKLAAAGCKTIERTRNKLGLSLILGGCGTTLEELTGMYTLFANEGRYIKPHYLKKEKGGVKKQIISAASVFMVNEILTQINRPDFPVNWSATEHMPKIAWKTGTSYGRRDAWSIGYNKNYTIGVWVGNFSGTGAPELTGANIATPLLFKIFNTIDYKNDKEWFVKPGSLEVRQVCSITGTPCSDNCTERITDYFIPLVSKSVPCNHLQEVKTSPDEKISYCVQCAPATGYKKKMYTVIDPELQGWYEMNNQAYEKIPLHNPDCETIFKNGQPIITSPTNQMEYFIDKNSPEPLLLSCNTFNDSRKVYWYINDVFYKAAANTEKIFFMPDEGPVKITCTDDKGRKTQIFISVKKIAI